MLQVKDVLTWLQKIVQFFEPGESYTVYTGLMGAVVPVLTQRVWNRGLLM